MKRLCLLSELIFKFNIMKKTICLFLFVIGFAATAQKNFSTNHFYPTFSSVNLKPVSFQINFTGSNLLQKGKNLSFYNPVTNLNDHYYVLGKSYIMSKTKSFPIHGFEGQRVDSFNPSGTKDLGSALIFSAITSILGKF